MKAAFISPVRHGIRRMLADVAWSWPAIVVASVWKIGFGGILYQPPVFGKWLARQVGLDRANLKAVPWAILLNIVGALLFNLLWDWTGAAGASEGAIVGAVAGLGLAATAAMLHPPFERRPTGVTALYGAHHFVEWIGVGVVFGLLA
jgi:uncharacterized protein DUF1761